MKDTPGSPASLGLPTVLTALGRAALPLVVVLGCAGGDRSSSGIVVVTTPQAEVMRRGHTTIPLDVTPPKQPQTAAGS